MYKKILKDANRYDDICNILKEIANIKDYDLPVRAFVSRKGGWENRIIVSNLKSESKLLLEILSQDLDSDFDMCIDDYENLYEFVNTYADDLLHNYAVSLSHKKDPEYNIEKVRPWLILSNLLICLTVTTKEEPWSIPDGWKKNDRRITQ